MLIILLQDKDPALRHAAVTFIGEYEIALKAAKQEYPDWARGLEGGTETDQSSTPRKLIARLLQLKVEDQLRKLERQDLEQKVREAAAVALKRIISVR